MRVQQRMHKQFVGTLRPLARVGIAWSALFLFASAASAISWEATGGSQWWFDPENWSEADAMLIPPMGDEDNDPGTDDDLAVTTTDLNFVANTPENMWDQGDGIVYDPANDPFFADAANLRFTGPWGPQMVWRFYLGNAPVDEENTGLAKLTIRGDLSSVDDPGEGEPRWWVGRSSGTAGVPSNGIIIHESGVVTHNDGDLDLGSINTNVIGSFGNGTYDYRGGTLEQGFDPSVFDPAKRLRLSAGGSTGVGGVGTFIMRNPGSEAGGYVRVRSYQSAPFGGQGGFEPNGVTNGLGISEFHATSEGTRPIQVDELYLGNGQDTGEGDTGFRSSQLDIVLDEAPMIDEFGVPMDLGLFDVDWDGDESGAIIGPGAEGNSYGFTFSNRSHADPLSEDAVYEEGDIVEAMFGSSRFRWNIYYTGNIQWSDPGNSILDMTYGGGDGIDGPDTGTDVVLIGLDSIIMMDGLPGDYNENDVVDAADYTLWRDRLGQGESLPNDDTPGVGQDDYDRWVANFGNTAEMGSGALVSSSAVPEPGSIVLALLGSISLVGIGRRR